MAGTAATLGGFSLVTGYGNSNFDPNGTQQITPGGQSYMVNITGAQVVKATPGRCCKIVIGGTVGTGGTLTINDCTTTGAAAATNQIFTTAGTVAVGTVISLDWPCASGIVVSAFPTGGSPTVNISFN